MGFYCTPATSCPFSMAPPSLSEFMGTVHIHNTEQHPLAIDCGILHGLSHVCHQHLLGPHRHQVVPHYLFVPLCTGIYFTSFFLPLLLGTRTFLILAFPHPHHVCDHLHAHGHYDKLLLHSHDVLYLTRLLFGKDCDILHGLAPVCHQYLIGQHVHRVVCLALSLELLYLKLFTLSPTLLGLSTKSSIPFICTGFSITIS